MRSRSIAPVFLAVVSAAVLVSAQTTEEPKGWKFESLTVSSGEDALSSGIAGSLWLYNERENLSFNAVVQHEQSWIIVGKRYTVGAVTLEPGVSFGQFQREPWVGPYLTASAPGPKLFGMPTRATSMLWPIVLFREPDAWRNDGVMNPESLLTGTYAEVGVWVGPVNVFFGGLDFLDDPKNKLPGIAFQPAIGEHWSARVSATHNHTTGRMMYLIGITYSSR